MMLIPFSSIVESDQLPEAPLTCGPTSPPKSRKPRKRMHFLASEMMTVKVRPRIQRAFFSWLALNRHRLSIDLYIEGRTDRYVKFSFVGINRAISAALNHYEICVAIDYNGECWDLMGGWDASPRPSAKGYFCRSCRDYYHTTNPDEEFTQYFPSREAVWEDDIFEPFLRWVNDDLAKAEWLGIYGKWGGVTWARLKDTSPDRKEANGLTALLLCRVPWMGLSE